jgi:hypothetical protein
VGFLAVVVVLMVANLKEPLQVRLGAMLLLFAEFGLLFAFFVFLLCTAK